MARVTISSGEVAVKLGRLNDQIVQIAPEYESCADLAKKTGLPLREIYDAAMQAARNSL